MFGVLRHVSIAHLYDVFGVTDVGLVLNSRLDPDLLAPAELRQMSSCGLESR